MHLTKMVSVINALWLSLSDRQLIKCSVKLSCKLSMTVSSLTDGLLSNVLSKLLSKLSMTISSLSDGLLMQCPIKTVQVNYQLTV